MWGLWKATLCLETKWVVHHELSPTHPCKLAQSQIPMKLAFPKEIQSPSGHIILIRYCVLFIMLITYQPPRKFRINSILPSLAQIWPGHFLRLLIVIYSVHWHQNHYSWYSLSLSWPTSPSPSLSSSCPVFSSSHTEAALYSQFQEFTFVLIQKADWAREDHVSPKTSISTSLWKMHPAFLNPSSPFSHLPHFAHIFPKDYTLACHLY